VSIQVREYLTIALVRLIDREVRFFHRGFVTQRCRPLVVLASIYATQYTGWFWIMVSTVIGVMELYLERDKMLDGVT
jgi:hypothetical protein